MQTNSVYCLNGGMFWPTSNEALNLHQTLPAGTYTVGCDPMKGWFLNPITDFNIGTKVYGDAERNADRILNTFEKRPNQTGALLSGEKGSGKTMLAKLVSQKGISRGYPTLVINAPLTGDGFNAFIQNIQQPCIIIFDEFEKNFDEDAQEKVLTLLDGVFPSKKLFILTCNDQWRINQHMRNRPGRIFYAIDYKGLTVEFIREYCEDNLTDKSHIDTICRLSMLFENFNFDMLKALVEDMNRYNETPQQVLRLLNAKPTSDGGNRYDVRVIHQGNEVPADRINNSQIRGNPLTLEELQFWIDGEEDKDGNEISEGFQLEVGNRFLKKTDAANGTYTYVLKEGTPEQTVVILTKVQRNEYNWMDAF